MPIKNKPIIKDDIDDGRVLEGDKNLRVFSITVSGELLERINELVVKSDLHRSQVIRKLIVHALKDTKWVACLLEGL